MRGVKTGGRKVGTPNKATSSIRDAAQAYTGEAVQTLVDLMRDITTPAAVRLAAANALLDRGHGKPGLADPTEDGNEPVTAVTITVVDAS